MLISSPQTRLLTTNRTTSAAAITAGRYTWATLATLLSTTEAIVQSLRIAMGPNGDGVRRRGVEVQIIGTGANNVTGTCRVWQLKWGKSSTDNPPVIEFELAYLGSIAATLSAAVGASDSAVVKTTERIADTLVWTQGTASTSPKGIADVLDSIYQATAAAAYSPANDTPGRMFLPECGNGDILLEPYTGGSATDINAVYESLT